MSKEELNECLKCFYTSARKKDGTFYKSTSIRAAIDRFLRSPPHNKAFSIISDAVFTGANNVLDAFVKDLRRTGKVAGIVPKIKFRGSLKAASLGRPTVKIQPSCREWHGFISLFFSDVEEEKTSGS